jgi:hypothetical protein
MPTIPSATGGKIVIVSGSKELAVGHYSLKKSNKHGGTTGSHTGGWETAGVVVTGGRITAEIFWDTTSGMDPFTLGIDGSWVANLWAGSSGKMWPAVALLTEDLDVGACDQENMLKFTVDAKINSALPSLTAAA